MAFFDRVAGLEREHASFAIATVVARRSPVSSHLGDRAVIFADGRMEGFVGGSCSRDIVRRHAVGAIRNRQPVLLQIRPDARSAADEAQREETATNTERVIIPMSCSSEGAVDVYIEPRVPLRRLIVVGLTPVAEALARLAQALDYDVVRVVTESELRDLPTPPMAESTARRTDRTPSPTAGAPSRTEAHASIGSVPLAPHADPVSGTHILELKSLRGFLEALDELARRDLVAIVASQGHYDELALEAFLARPVGFTGLLASRRRAATVLGVLAQQGVPADRLATIHHPVGLDIGARSPGEVAVSILAQIIAHAPAPHRDGDPVGTPTRTLPPTSSAPAAPAQPPAAHDGDPEDTFEPPAETILEAALGGIEIDPVCGMEVDVATALYRFEHAGTAYYFCGAHCRASFSAAPETYLVQLGRT